MPSCKKRLRRRWNKASLIPRRRQASGTLSRPASTSSITLARSLVLAEPGKRSTCSGPNGLRPRMVLTSLSMLPWILVIPGGSRGPR